MKQPRALPAPSRVSAVAILAVIAALVASAVIASRPPAVSSTPSTDAFDTKRTLEHLEQIARGPSPISSAANDRNRDYLLQELRELGIDAEVHSGVGVRTFGDQVVAGRADNVVATIPGSDPTGQLVLAAHYDSTPTTPGTSDDKMSVAVILEVARHLSEGEAPRNDVLLLLSDGEEPGLIGAEAFAEHHPAAERGGVLLNLEGPGNSGASALYNFTANNGALVDLYAGAAPYPAGESAMASVYRNMPHHSDFTTLEENSFIGLELGPLDGRVYYHHPRDTVDALDLGTLYQHGANTLALTHALMEADLEQMRSDADATFFTLGDLVVHYPGVLVWPLALLAVVAVAALSLLGRATNPTTVPRLVGAALTSLVPVLLAVAAGWVLWQGLTLVRPEYGDLLPADPAYRPEYYRWALIVLAPTIVWVWHLLTRRWFGTQATLVGALAVPAMFGVAMAAIEPGVAYLGSLPALTAAVAGLAALAVGADRPRLRLAVLAVGIVPGAVLILFTGYQFMAALGMEMGAPIASLGLAMAGLIMLPLVAEALSARDTTRRRRRAVLLAPAAALTVSLALASVGLAVDRYDDDHPRMAHLVHITDADSGTSQWASYNTAPTPWVQGYVSQEQAEADSHLALPKGVWFEYVGQALNPGSPAPEIEVHDVRSEQGDTVLDLTVRSHRDAYALVLHLDQGVIGGTVDVAGLPQSELPAQEMSEDSTKALPYEIHFFAPPAEGVRLSVRVEGTDRPELAVSDATLGLQDLPEFDPRPAEVVVAPSLGAISSDTVIITRAHQW